MVRTRHPMLVRGVRVEVQLLCQLMVQVCVLLSQRGRKAPQREGKVPARGQSAGLLLLTNTLSLSVSLCLSLFLSLSLSLSLLPLAIAVRHTGVRGCGTRSAARRCSGGLCSLLRICL